MAQCSQSLIIYALLSSRFCELTAADSVEIPPILSRLRIFAPEV